MAAAPAVNHGDMRDHEQRTRASQAWDVYDFEPSVVKDYDNGWVRVDAATLKRTVFFESPGGAPSVRATFVARFDPGDLSELVKCDITYKE